MAIEELLDEDPWQLIVPLKLYHHLNKMGRCCCCFPGVADLIIEVTGAYHRRHSTPENQIICLLERVQREYLAREAARRAARRNNAAARRMRSLAG